MTVTTSQIQELVGSLTYKPGWKFKFDGKEIHTTYKTKDLHTYKSFVFGFHTEVLEQGELTDKQWLERLLESVWRSIKEIEGHERMEYFKSDSVPIWDAHAFKKEDGLLHEPWCAPKIPERLLSEKISR